MKKFTNSIPALIITLVCFATAIAYAAAPGALRIDRYNDEGTALAKAVVVPVTAQGLVTTDSTGTPVVIAKSAFVAETVKDQRTGTAIKRWSGTQTQYDAIATKDAATEYNIFEE